MRRRIIVAVIAVLWIQWPIAAQNQCGEPLLPCGPIPWQLPSWPQLVSPTKIGTQTPGVINPADPTATATPSITPTPFQSSTPFEFVASIDDTIATMNALADATDIPIDFQGTPIDDGSLMGFGSDVSTFFSYAKGLTQTSFGPFSGLISLLLIALAVVIFVQVANFALPLLALLIGIIRKVYHAILDLIPG